MLTESTRENYPLVAHAPGGGPQRLFAPLLIAAAVVAGLIALATGGLLAYGLSYGPNVYSGVSVASVDVGGLPVGDVQQRIEAHLRDAAPSRVTLIAGDQEWVVGLDELGVRFDSAATAQRAVDYGRSGNLWRDARAWAASLFGGHDVPLVVSLDPDAVYAVLTEVAPSVTRPAYDARYVFNTDGTLAVEPGADGLGIDVQATAKRLTERLSVLSSQPVAVATVPVEATVDATMLESGLKQARQMVAEPLILELNGAEWEVSPETLQQLLTVTPGKDGKPGQVGLRPEQLAPYLASLASQVEQPGQDARVVWDGSRFGVEPGSPGLTLDIDATVAEISRVLAAGEHRATLQLGPAAPLVADEDASDAARRANQLVSRPLSVTWAGGSRTLDPATLAQAIVVTPQPDANPRLSVDFSDEALAGIVQGLAPEVEVPGKNADLRYYGGVVQVVSPEQVGIALDVEASAAALKAALRDGASSVALVTRTIEPEVTAAMAETVVIRERISMASSPYGDSVANRRHNVELSVERANGALVPPGGTYSFVDTVGAIDLDSGYKVGYGIVGTSNGSVSTVPSVGGGICQVSTTVFQAAFWAGMPIIERNWHLYWIALYGIEPYGMLGLDATVDTDYGLDFKFKNTTDDWLAVVAYADGSWVTFELWGTDPGWEVSVDDPVVTNVVKANTEMQYQESSQVPPGQQLHVERAQDGFDVAIHRQVTKDGEVIDDLTLRSHYRPSANVTLVGVE